MNEMPTARAPRLMGQVSLSDRSQAIHPHKWLQLEYSTDMFDRERR